MTFRSFITRLLGGGGGRPRGHNHPYKVMRDPSILSDIWNPSNLNTVGLLQLDELLLLNQCEVDFSSLGYLLDMINIGR